MITIAGHTLFPHTADWSTSPTWKRKWQTGITQALSGVEQRSALRNLPLHTLQVSMLMSSLDERARFDARLDQALKSGLAAVPLFGYGTEISSAAAEGANTLELDDAVNPWPFAVYDFVILLGADDTVFDCWQVTNVAGNTLTLAGNLANTWLAGVMVRPVLFGNLTMQPAAQITDWHSQTAITIAQRVAERNAQLGNLIPDAGVGVGHDTVGVDNDIA
ncbi:MAG TPA: hypothetical protein VGO57_14270 [Verrucomicrobiae bacterium]|jgi:hypothetical protein